MDPNEAYIRWADDPTPENLAATVDTLAPTITSEIQRYTGPKPLLRSKGRALAVKAIKTYDPTRGAALRSWTVTQLQPLSRYGQRLKPVRSSEMATRQAAEVETQRQQYIVENDTEPTDEQLADRVGISVPRIQKLRERVTAVVPESAMVNPESQEIELPAVSEVSSLDFASKAVYDGLSPRERSVFDWKTGAKGKPPMENKEIARRLGITPAAVSQISANIAGRIKEVSDYGV